MCKKIKMFKSKNKNENFDIDYFTSLFYTHLNEEEKTRINILFEYFKKEDWIKLVNIWEKSSSLLRYNNTKNEINEILFKYQLIIHNYNAMFLGLQYYVDKKNN